MGQKPVGRSAWPVEVKVRSLPVLNRRENKKRGPLFKGFSLSLSRCLHLSSTGQTKWPADADPTLCENFS
jgi:hypothetical protein